MSHSERSSKTDLLDRLFDREEESQYVDHKSDEDVSEEKERVVPPRKKSVRERSGRESKPKSQSQSGASGLLRSASQSESRTKSVSQSEEEYEEEEEGSVGDLECPRPSGNSPVDSGRRPRRYNKKSGSSKLWVWAIFAFLVILLLILLFVYYDRKRKGLSCNSYGYGAAFVTVLAIIVLIWALF